MGTVAPSLTAIILDFQELALETGVPRHLKIRTLPEGLRRAPGGRRLPRGGERRQAFADQDPLPPDEEWSRGRFRRAPARPILAAGPGVRNDGRSQDEERAEKTRHAKIFIGRVEPADVISHT